jgi:hypothetical protein
MNRDFIVKHVCRRKAVSMMTVQIIFGLYNYDGDFEILIELRTKASIGLAMH